MPDVFSCGILEVIVDGLSGSRLDGCQPKYGPRLVPLIQYLA